MSVLVVDYGAIEGLNRTAGSLTRKLQKTIDDYEGIAKAINSLPSPRSNLDNANYFTRKKAEQNQLKIDKLNAFNARMSSFSDLAEATDKQVANRISSETKAFKKANNISISPLAVLDSFLPWNKIPLVRELKYLLDKTVRTAKYAIKDWYRNGGKELLKNIAGVAAIAALLVASIVTLGAIAVAAGISLSALAIMGAVGMGVGIVSQLASDLVTSAISGEWKLSSWQTYVGAGLGGLISGLATPILGPTVAVAISSGASTFIGQTLENSTGGEKRSFGEILFNTMLDTTLGVALSKIPLMELKGVNKGRNSMQAVFKSGLTKLINRTASRMSLSVFVKGAVSKLYGDTISTVLTGFKQYLVDECERTLVPLKKRITGPAISPALRPIYRPVQIL